MLQSTTRTQLDQLKGALSGFEAISKETILALEIEVVEGGTELQKKKESWCWQKQNSTTDYIK
jgi:exonuclease SbcC